jgi:hypothetical protein
LGGTQSLAPGLITYQSKQTTEEEVDERVFISNSKSLEKSASHMRNKSAVDQANQDQKLVKNLTYKS